MPRRPAAVTLLLVPALTAGVVAAPVMLGPHPRPHPVAPTVLSLPLRPAGAPALRFSHLRGRSARVLATLAPRHARFDLVGATWRSPRLDSGSATVQVRVHDAAGWSHWTALSGEDGGADGGSPDARRAAARAGTAHSAAPLWVGRSDAVQARVVGPPAARLAAGDVRVVVVDGGRSAADAQPMPQPAGAASAATTQPTIYTRADWGADESLRQHACSSGPGYSPTIKMGFIHHTDNANGYTRAQVPAIIRSIYAYHVQSNGWCDIGYNFLVDRFGRIWQGRYGGITKAVVGAHTGGFNYDTFGVALIGTFNSTTPSSAMTSAVEHLFAWQFARYYLDPLGSTTLTAAAFSGSKFTTGSSVTFKTVSGHRDADYTDCPGSSAYGELGTIRGAIRSLVGAGFVTPRLSTPSAMMGAGPVQLSAGVIGKQTWTLTVLGPTGVQVAQESGTATRSQPVAASWDLTTAGVPAPPGSYTLQLTGTDAGGDSATPWSTTFTVTPPVTVSVPAQVGLGAAVTARGTGVAGHQLSVDVTDGGAQRPLGTVTVSSAGRWTAPAAVTADSDLTFTATDPQASGYQAHGTSRVGPTLSAPSADPTYVAAGQPVSFAGSALPANGAAVTVKAQPVGSSAGPASVATAPVAGNGTWSVAVTPSAASRMWVVDGRGLASPAVTVDPVAPPTATAPASGYADRTVVVSGNAGNAPVTVTLATRPAGGSWTSVGTTTAAGSGAFTISLRLPDSAGSTQQWRVSTGYGKAVTGSVAVQPVFPPTVSGPTYSGRGVTHFLHGTAVPGDVVTVWTAPAGTTTWTRLGRVRAAADDSWSLAAAFTVDTTWRATSPSGTSASGSTWIVPTIRAPSSVAAGSVAVVRGTALPGQSLTLSRRAAGSSAWLPVRTLTVAADGTWRVRCHPSGTMSYRATSHGQQSRVATVRVG